MDRKKAIEILTRCEAEAYCSHYKQHFCCIGCGQREALDLAIEALQGDLHCPKCGTIVRDGRQYHDLVYRGEAEQVTSKLKNPCDSLLKPDSDECKEQKSKLDLISREWVLDKLNEKYKLNRFEEHNDMANIGIVQAENITENAPSVTPTERTGEWVKNDDYVCDQCGYHMIVGGGAYNFCPNCGAYMRGEKE